MGEKCGDLNMHWYQDGPTCVCGQVPEDIFFAATCNCGASRSGRRKPIHSPDCNYIAWAEKRNKWIDEHPTQPPLNRVSAKASEHYKDWNSG